MFGGAERDRTVGLQSAILALSQLSYCPINKKPQSAWRIEHRARKEIQTTYCIAPHPVPLPSGERDRVRGPIVKKLNAFVLFPS
jgi:hypothetical protein